MGNRRGNPFRHGKGWAFTYFEPDAEGKNKRRQKSGYPTKRAADEAKRIKEAEILNRVNLKNERLKAKEFFTDWLENEKRSGYTYDTYLTVANAVYRYIIPEIGHIPVSELNRSDLQKLLNKVHAVFPGVARIVKTAVSGAMLYALEERYSRYNPALNLRMPKSDKTKKKKRLVLDADEMSVLMRKAWDLKSPIFMEVLLSLTLGVRKAELRGLKYSDIDNSSSMIHVQRALGRKLEVSLGEEPDKDKWGQITKEEKTLKTQNSNRFIRIPDFVMPYIDAHQKKYMENRDLYGVKFRDDGYICCSEKGQPRCTSYMYKPFKKLLQETGLPNIRWHDMRHTYASYLADNETALTAIARSLGHQKYSLTGDVYVHPGISETMAMKSMNNFVAGLLSPKTPLDSAREASSLPRPQSPNFVPQTQIANFAASGRRRFEA